MGLLDNLWDETLAKPTPETGVLRRRQTGSVTFWSDSDKEAAADARIARDSGDGVPEDSKKATRSIRIRRPAGIPWPEIGMPAASPARSTPPETNGSVFGETGPLNPLRDDLEEDWQKVPLLIMRFELS